MGRAQPKVPAEYVVGITDGEGCFYVNISESAAYRMGWQVQLHFHLKLQEADKDLLWKIRNTLDCGNVYYQKETRSNHAQCYRYTVSSQKDIFEKVIPFFKKYPLQSTSKLKSFTFFCRIADLVREKQHLMPGGVEQIRVLKEQMNKRTSGSRSAGNPHATWEREVPQLSQSARQPKGAGSTRSLTFRGPKVNSVTRGKS